MAGGKARNKLHIISFAAIMSVAVYIVMDIECPRLELLRVQDFDQALVELQASMK